MITLTETAANKVREFFDESGMEENKRNLRIKVKGGGCSGFTYVLAFDEKKEKDQVFESFGVKVICDSKSYLYVNDSVIDYASGLMGSGFKLNNPNAKGSCGCGQSFSYLTNSTLSAILFFVLLILSKIGNRDGKSSKDRQ